MVSTPHLRRPNSLASWLRRILNAVFWRKKLSPQGEKVPDYNRILLAYLVEKAISLTCATCPQLPTFQRAVAHEANRRRAGGRRERK